MTARSPGARVGAYTLVERLAVGGMSEVFLATQPGGARVVLKLLGEPQMHDTVLRDLLRNEAALAHAAAHPNVVRVLEQGESEHEPFIALEYVDGVDLWRLQRALQHTQRRMEAPLACHVVRELLAGIAHIHSLQAPGGGALVHRDVSPSNVFLSRDGDVKLGDFGIALPARSPSSPPAAQSSSPPTPTGAVTAARIHRGKAGYMAPEQLQGQPVDPRVDLYAAGVVLAEVLTGRALFAGLSGTTVSALLTQREQAVEALGEVLADHPPSLVSVVMRGLARTPAERFQSAQEFRVALLPHVGDVNEARPLLAALVHWARTSAQRVTSGAHISDTPPLREASGASDTPQGQADAEITREVIDVYYDLLDDNGGLRGRHTLARLVELALADSVGPHDALRTPEGRVVRASDLSELAPVLPQRTAPASEQAGAVADWADELSAWSLLHALGRLILAEETGLLVAEAPAARRALYLHRGEPTHLAPVAAQGDFGDFLVQQGLITRGELDMALAIAPRLGGDVAEALVHLELIDSPGLARAAARLAREQLLEAFRWRRGTLRFFRGVDPAAGAVALQDEASSLLHAGAMLLDNPQEHFAPHLERRVGIAPSVRGLHRLGLSTVGHDLLALANGKHTVARMVQRVAYDRRATPDDVLRALYFLLEVGVVELRD